MNRRSIRDALVLVVVAAFAARLLSALGNGVLAAPRAWGLDGWTELVIERGPAAAAMTLLRYAALALSAYLGVLGLLTLTARLIRVRWLDKVLWFATPRILRPVLGIVAVATFAAPHAAGAAEAASNPPAMVLVGWSTGHATTSTTLASPSPLPTMRRVDRATSTTVPTTTIPSTFTVPAPTAGPTTTIAVAITLPPTLSPAADRAATPPPPARTWSIKRGEHLWFVAETVLTQQLGHVPSTTEITRYWKQLISANHDRLVDPANPDLVFTGQELVLPAL